MSDKKNSGQSLRNIRRIQNFMIVVYALMIIVTVSIVSQLAVKKSDEVLKNKVISLTSSLSMQMKLNMDGYLSRMETIATLAFADELTYTYDASDPNNDEYDALNKEKELTARLNSLCIMENFVDYGIVYRNNRKVGKISNGSSALFGDKMFEELEAMVTRTHTNDGWASGYAGDFRRIYYVKRVHDNAVLFLSFYSDELNTVFDNPETLSDMEIRLLNEDHDIIYSKDTSEVGKLLPRDILQKIQGQTSASVLGNDQLVSVNKCDDWYVVCSISTDIILDEKNEVTRYIYAAGGIAALLAAIFGGYISGLLTRPVKRIVASLDDKAHIDLLTGVLNKLSFEELAEGCLARSLDSEQRALVILDIDDFKGVNDTLGHAWGDKVLKNTGEILRETFSGDDYLGRVGGDEFCVLVNARFDSNEKFTEYLNEKCSALSEAFRSNYAGEDGSCKISASMGVSVFPSDGKTFAELYRASDKALYRSKKSGKDTYSFYGEAAEQVGGDE